MVVQSEINIWQTNAHPRPFDQPPNPFARHFEEINVEVEPRPQVDKARERAQVEAINIVLARTALNPRRPHKPAFNNSEFWLLEEKDGFIKERSVIKKR